MTHYFFSRNFDNVLRLDVRNDNDVYSYTFMASKRKHASSYLCEAYKKVSPKHLRRNSTLLERLPNELFLEIFNYLANVDVVYAFSQLNNRFHSLILYYCHTFDFKSVSKAKFKFVIAKHNTQQWRALRLSDDDDTPGQISLFSQLYPFAQYVSSIECLVFREYETKNCTVYPSTNENIYPSGFINNWKCLW